jgi:TPR repeat protein
MSVPAQEYDDGPSKDGPLNYAPKKVRHPEPAPDPAGAPSKADSAGQNASPKREASGLAEPPWRWSRQRGAFAGDIAAVELRNRLALAPDRLPEPPPALSTSPRYRRLAVVVIVAAVGFVGYQLGSTPPSAPPDLAPHFGQSGQQALASKRSLPAAYPSPAVDSNSLAGQPGVGHLSAGGAVDTARGASTGPTMVNAAPAAQPSQPVLSSAATAKEIALPSNQQRSRAAAPRQAVSRQLTVGAVRPLQVDEAARLTVSAADAGANAAVVIGRLAPGSILSAGTQVAPNTWRLSAEELKRAVIAPPRGFVGVMAVSLELRLADDSVADRKDLRLEWSARNVTASAQPASRQHDAEEIAVMIKSGADLMANRDFAAARLMYQRAAEAGSAMAAFALAETYDPLMVGKLNVRGGISPDFTLAATWYEKAKALGSSEAPERLERLARLPEQ